MKKFSIFAKFKEKTGSTLMLVVIVFLVVVMMLTTVSVMALSNIKKSSKTSEYTSVYYVAETGLNQYLDGLKKFVETNKAQISQAPETLPSKYNTSLNSLSDHVLFPYQNIMGETSKANVSMQLENKDADGVFHFNVKSTGFIGNSQRTVSTSLAMKMEGKKQDFVVSLDMPAIFTIDPNASPDAVSLEFSGQRTVYGPYVTNGAMRKTNSGMITFIGPIVTGGSFYSAGQMDSKNALVVYKDFNILNNHYGTKVRALVFKNLNSKVRVQRYGGQAIDTLIVPIGYNLSNIVFNDGDSVVSPQDISTYIRKIVYYNPTNFNPYTQSAYVNNALSVNEIKEIFDVSDKWHYERYFEKDNIFNDLDNSTKKQAELPVYTLPAFPKLGSTKYPWFNQTGSTMAYGGIDGFVDSQNNMLYGANVAWNGPEIVTFNSSFSINKFTYNSWKPLTIDVGDRDIEIAVNKLDISGQKLEIVGTGSLTFIVTGNGGFVEEFNFGPEKFALRDKVGGPQVYTPTKLKMIVDKTNKGNGPKSLSFPNQPSLRIDMVVLSQDLNMRVANPFHGVFVSLEGASFDLSASGSSSFSGIVYLPKGTAKIENNFTGSILAKKYDMTQSGFATSSYSGSMSDEVVKDVMSYLNYQPGSAPGGGTGGNGSGNGAGSGDFSFSWSAPREVGE